MVSSHGQDKLQHDFGGVADNHALLDQFNLEEFFSRSRSLERLPHFAIPIEAKLTGRARTKPAETDECEICDKRDHVVHCSALAIETKGL